MINFSTGPVDMLPSVQEQLIAPPISHRSPEFAVLYHSVTSALCNTFGVRNAFVFTGSGTMANEVMIAQISLRRNRGLIITNGEFGERLAAQALRQGVNHQLLTLPWGAAFGACDLLPALRTNAIRWVLLCHCESSTGVLNPLEEIISLCRQYDADVYADCMSTAGNMAINLEGVAMATASSGKGLGSLAGLSLLLCNTVVLPGNSLPLYLDLHHTQDASGIPFTLSSNLLGTLNAALKYSLNPARWQQLNTFSESIYAGVSDICSLPFATPTSRIFTLTPAGSAQELAGHCLAHGIQLSYQSAYLRSRNWLQLALFGNYTGSDIQRLTGAICSWQQQCPITG